MRTFRLLTLLGAALLASSMHAQAPQGFSYQAVARDAFGTAVSGQPIGVQFVLHQGNALGAVVYAETHSTNTNSNGLFTLTVGAGATGTGTFSSIDWSNGPYFLEVAMDVNSSGSYTPIGTQQLMSVPYALYAGRSNVPDGTEVGQILRWDGNAWVTEPGLYAQGKRFGFGGETAPEAPVGIKGEVGQDDRMISFTSTDAVQKWNINLNPTGNDVDGFSIDDASTGTGSSRLFIAPVNGNVGIGTSDPDAALTIRSDNPLKAHFQNGNIPTQDDFWNTIDSYGLNTGQGNPDTGHVHLTLQSMTGHLGLGTNDPPAPLSIESREVLKTYFQTGDVPTQDQFGFTSDGTGFGIEQGAPDALTSRFFIQSSTGNVGIGTTSPQERFHMHAVHNGQSVGLRVSNGAVSTNGGWSLGHLNDELVAERNGAFSILEAPGSGGGAGGSRVVVLPGGNVGINEEMPMTTLHVTRPVSDPAAAVSLNENSGIAVFGPITQNLALDYQGIQARIAMAGGTSTTGSAGSLHLQPHGGDIIIHGAFDPILEDQKITITSDGKIGVGKLPVEKLEINGAIVVGNTALAAPENGTIRWTGSDFEGRKGGEWRSLTTHTNTDGFIQGSTPDVIHYSPASGGRVGINEPLPYATLHVSRPVSDPSTLISLSENSGIVVVGPITDNIVADHRGIQARHGEIVGDVLNLTASELNVQRLGGDVLFHGAAADASDRTILTSDGKLGLGVAVPTERVDIADAYPDFVVGIKMRNNASTQNAGWRLGHLQVTGERNGAFSILEETGTGPVERMTVLPSGNIGVNEPLPDTKFHVSRPVSDPATSIDLTAGTGIAQIGPMTDNVVIDYRGIQARTGVDAGGSWNLSAGPLHLQRRGGGLILHETAGSISARAEITPDGKLGLGVLAPVERIDIDGAIKIGNSLGNIDGTIRFNGTDFQGRAQGAWRSLGSEWQKVDNTDDAIHFSASSGHPKVGIGINQPNATLHVRQQDPPLGQSSTGLFVETIDNSINLLEDREFIGLRVYTQASSPGTGNSKNIGLYVSNVSGQSSSERNLAAVLNGNVVVGDINAQRVGTGGANVLAIQNGTAPAAPSGTPTTGIQIYSGELAPGAPSVLHLMTSDGAVIKLYRAPAITAADESTIGSTYDPTTAALIENMRTRINELEAILKAMGLLTP